MRCEQRAVLAALGDWAHQGEASGQRVWPERGEGACGRRHPNSAQRMRVPEGGEAERTIMRL